MQFLSEPYPSAAIAATTAPEQETELELESQPQPQPVASQHEEFAAEPEAEHIVESQHLAGPDTVEFVQAETEQFKNLATPLKNRIAMESEVSLCAAAQTLDAMRYIVLVDAVNNSLTRTELLQQLREQGVDDMHALPGSGSHGKVSLGFYSKLANAEKRQAEISSLGFQVALEPQPTKTAEPLCHTEEQIAASGI